LTTLATDRTNLTSAIALVVFEALKGYSAADQVTMLLPYGSLFFAAARDIEEEAQESIEKEEETRKMEQVDAG
jgi:hypothetical protein